MAIYRTNTTELTSIADAIRAKTGSNSSLVYPTGFVSAINNINIDDRPIFTITYDENYEITNITCNKTYNQVYNRVMNEDKWDITIYYIEPGWDPYNNGSSLYKSGSTLFFYITNTIGLGATRINYTSNGNITWNDYWRLQQSSDITTSGNTITIPWGAYYNDVTKTITDSNLTAGNIKKDINILGVTGTYAGEPYNWMGENATLVDTLYEYTYKLSDTSFNASNVSTSNTTILDTTYLETIYLPAQYDHILKLLITTDYQYTTTLTNTAHMLEGYFCGILPVGRKPATINDFTNNTVSMVSHSGAYVGYSNLFVNNNGGQEWTVNGYGISFSMNGPQLSNQQADNFGINVALPPIRINYNNYYMKQDAINALDTENTTIHMKYELYRCNQNDIWHGIYGETVKLYQAKHNIT